MIRSLSALPCNRLATHTLDLDSLINPRLDVFSLIMEVEIGFCFLRIRRGSFGDQQKGFPLDFPMGHHPEIHSLARGESSELV